MSGVIDIIDTPGASSFGDIDNISLSPDGRYVAIEAGDELSSANDQPMQIWIYDSDQFSATRLTFQGARNAQPRWMPDGRHVAYISSQVDGPDGIWMQPFDRTGTDELVVQTDWPVEAFDVAAVEGLPMILTDASGPTRDLWLAYPGTSEVEPFLVTDFSERLPRISPDGQWVAYVSDESGQDEVYVRSFPEGGRPWPVSRSGGSLPIWSHSGDAIFFVRQGFMMEARLSLRDEVRIVEESTLFETTGIDATSFGSGSAYYDLSGDDERFLAPLALSATNVLGVENAETVVVLNLFEELRQRMGN